MITLYNKKPLIYTFFDKCKQGFRVLKNHILGTKNRSKEIHYQ